MDWCGPIDEEVVVLSCEEALGRVPAFFLWARVFRAERSAERDAIRALYDEGRHKDEYGASKLISLSLFL